MVANILFIAFVSAFCAVVLYGHYLLLLAVWPNLLTRRGDVPEEPSDIRATGQAEPASPQHSHRTEKIAA
jgi:hypothetical protein